MNLNRINPFARLDRPRVVWAWGMYDLANQSFTLIVNTMIFAVFFKEVVVQDEARDDTLWAATVAVSMLLVVLVSPIAGAIGDITGRRKTMLLATGFGCALLTCALGLIPTGGLLVAMALYIPANFCFALGENFLASYLPIIAKPSEAGRVSGIGWTMGYAGALVLLVLTAGAMLLFGLDTPETHRPLLVFAGLWFLVMALPTALFVPSDPRRARDAEKSVLREAGERVFGTLRDIAPRRDLALFFVAFLIYGVGVQTVIFFAGVLAKDFGIEGAGLALFLLQLTVTAGIGAIVPTLYQDRIGHKRTVQLFLAVWIVAGLCLAWLAGPGQGQTWGIWVIGNLLGFGLGGIGTSTRALVGYMTPAHRAAESFGFWGLVYKLAGVCVIGFGLVKDQLGAPAALLGLSGCFVVGALILIRVDVDRGAASARADEREHAGEIEPEDIAALH